MTKKFRIININDKLSESSNLMNMDCKLLYFILDLILLFTIIYLIYKYILSK